MGGGSVTSRPHIIPDSIGACPNIYYQGGQQTKKGPHIVLDVDDYDSTIRYIHTTHEAHLDLHMQRQS